MADENDIGGSDSAPCCADLTTKELVKTVNQQELETPSFLLNAFFRNIIRSEKDKVEVQSRKVKADRKLAPFVCPCVEGKPNEELDGWSSLEITPAYVKQKDALNACHKALATRGYGEVNNGEYVSITRRMRRDAHLARLLGRQVGRIMRTEEWMASQGIMKGGMQIRGDRYPTQLVRMPRWDDKYTMEQQQNQKLGCTDSVLDYRIYQLCNKKDVWNNTSTDIAAHVEEIVSYMFEKADSNVTDVLVGRDVYKAIRTNKTLRETAKLARDLGTQQFGDTNFNFGFERPINEQSVRFLGDIVAGSGLRFWQYNGTYQDVVRYDNAGQELDRDQWYTIERPFIPRDVAVFIDNSDGDSGLDGTRFYGAIMDLDWDFQVDGPQSRFVKRWSQPDPSCWHFMTQSAPLVLPCNADASLAICLVESEEGGLCLKPKSQGDDAVPSPVLAPDTQGQLDMAAVGYQVAGQRIFDRKGSITQEEANKRVAVSASEWSDAMSAAGEGATVSGPEMKEAA